MNNSFFFLTGVMLVHSVVLVSAVQWSLSYMHTYIPPPCWTSLLPGPPSSTQHPIHPGYHRALSWAPWSESGMTDRLTLSRMKVSSYSSCLSQGQKNQHMQNKWQQFLQHICHTQRLSFNKAQSLSSSDPMTWQRKWLGEILPPLWGKWRAMYYICVWERVSVWDRACTN